MAPPRKPTIGKSVRTVTQKRVEVPYGPRSADPVEARRKSIEQNRITQNNRDRQRTTQARDIGLFSLNIDWDRRLRCKNNLKQFASEYMSSIFFLDWSKDQEDVADHIMKAAQETSKYAIAMQRGGGKTALCRAGLLNASLYGKKEFLFFVGSSGAKSTQTLAAIKTQLYRNKKFQQDFPEICYPILKIENRWHLAGGQLFNGELTYIEWGSDTIRFACCSLPEEIRDHYLEHDPTSVIYVEESDCWVSRAAGTIIKCAGIDGSIRGEADAHPIKLTQPRPDMVLLDDIQKDQKADSPVSCAKLVALIDGAIEGLAGPEGHISALMPCTISRTGDVSSTYTNPSIKPDWLGKRCPMVLSWPPGITDILISSDTLEGRLWSKYIELRKQSLRLHKDIRLATEFYKLNMDEMNHEFVVAWPDRYNKETELSAQQHAMEKRIRNPVTFCYEFQQNAAAAEADAAITMISAEQLTQKTLNIPRLVCPIDTQYTATFIDVQNEINFFLTLTSNPDLTGIIADFGTWPEVHSHYFSKSQTEGWSLLSKAFFQAYPEQLPNAIKTEHGAIRAPLEAKIYFGLQQTLKHIQNRQLMKLSSKLESPIDPHASTLLPENNVNSVIPFNIGKIGIDMRWGQVNSTIKEFVRYSECKELVPCTGQDFPPTRKQLEEYTRTPGWLFEDQINKEASQVKWVYKPDQSGLMFLEWDSSRMKDFAHARLATPVGERGSISIHQNDPGILQMLADHICESEYPDKIMARGIEKNHWKPRAGRADNDFLDCLVGAMALLMLQGAKLTAEDRGHMAPTRRRRLSELYYRKNNRH